MMADIALASPFIALSLGALLLLCLDVSVRGEWPRVPFTIGTLVLAIVLLAWQLPNFAPGKLAFGGLLFADGFVAFTTLVVLVGALLSVMIAADYVRREGIEASAEYYALLLMTTAGAIVFLSSAELITLFVGLEVMSMAVYCMCGAALTLKRSAESAMKYFLLGSFSSAFLLYGIALIYGLTGTTFLFQINQTLPPEHSTMLLAAVGLMLVGLAFKVSAAPFHFWAPDVYQGAPTPVTAYMAVVVKAAAVAVLLRVLWGGFGDLLVFWAPAVWYLALFTMTTGNLLALRQRSLKRMLAYSSIAHAGYMLVALLAPSSTFGGGPAVLYYLIAYTLMTLGAFGVVMVVTSNRAEEPFPDSISRFNGLAGRMPVVAALMAFFMLSLAGLPPGMSGLLGKFYVFSAAVKADYEGLVIIGVLNSAVSVYYYLRVVVAMYFLPASGEEEPASAVSVPMVGALTFCALSSLLIGVFPSGVFESAAAVLRSFHP